MNLSEPFWLRRTHTILLGGHGAALLFLANIFSTKTNTLEVIRENINLFCPFALGLLFLFFSAQRGVKLDTYKALLENRDKLEDKIFELENNNRITKANRLRNDLNFVKEKIKHLSKAIKRTPWISKYCLNFSAFLFLIGILMISVGDKLPNLWT